MHAMNLLDTNSVFPVRCAMEKAILGFTSDYIGIQPQCPAGEITSQLTTQVRAKQAEQNV